MIINPSKTPKEPTYQVVLDALALSPLYPAFLITAEVLEIYMHQHPNQEFIVPPSSDEEIVSFIKELGYLGDIDSVSKVYIYHMHQPWRTLAIVNSRCLSGKTTEPIEKLVKKPAARRRSAGVQVRDTPRDSNEDVDDDDQQSDDEQTESNNDKSVDLNKTDDEEEKEFLHTPDDYVPTDDENKDDEEYAHINKEMYDDMNMKLRDTEREGVRKDDEKMTDVGHVAAEHENVNQEVIGDQVKDDAQETVITAHAIQKTEVPLPSSSILSDYATKFLNFDNIPSANTEIISMIDIKVQHVNPCIHTSPLLTILVLRKKSSKDDEPSKKEKSTESSKGTTKSQPKSTGKSTQAKETMFEAGDTQVPHNQGDDMGNIDEPPVVYVDSKEWFKKPERLPTQDPKWNE
nr:hypothetical protein [Tanacetum cinerariifolium]